MLHVYVPVCVLMCLLRSEGRSNFLPQISHGSHVRSLFLLTGRSVGTICSGLLLVMSDSEHSSFIYKGKNTPIRRLSKCILKLLVSISFLLFVFLS